MNPHLQRISMKNNKEKAATKGAATKGAAAEEDEEEDEQENEDEDEDEESTVFNRDSVDVSGVTGERYFKSVYFVPSTSYQMMRLEVLSNVFCVDAAHVFGGGTLYVCYGYNANRGLVPILIVFSMLNESKVSWAYFFKTLVYM